MSNGLTSFVPVLTGPNYLQWALKMQAFLQTTGRWMQPMTKTCPTLVATPSNQDKVDTWNEDNTAARGSIRLHVDDSIGTAIDSKTTAKQVWDYLKDTYGKPGIPVVYQDFRAAMGISIPSDSNPIPAMDKLHAHFQTLETNQFTIAEHIKGMILLSKLPSAMDPIIQVYTSGLTATQTTPAVQLVTFDEVRNRVIMYWEQRQGRHQQKPRDSANKISAVKRKPQDPTFCQHQQRPQGQQQQGHRGRRGGHGRSQQHQGAHQHAHIAHIADTFPVITKGEMDTLPQSRDPHALLHKPVRAETGANNQYPVLRRAFTLAKKLGIEPTTERIRKLRAALDALIAGILRDVQRGLPHHQPEHIAQPNALRGQQPKHCRHTLKERIRPHLRERIGTVVEDEDMEETVSLGLSSEDEQDDNIEEFFDRQCD
ncbi:hypothetical protein GSI_00240 [Ganoderma sinense ZZ0214-1]|uniref:DUF4219 domain-containing protein n=1 Tax=Ganoderma sinense ZZ0214-1 TaxID=1077348 RepID=A0A2G8SRZ0_9APHY|nr:hypothetical protein GSI_00240 [Ganoderma sinense ZZ0214-1]